MEAAAGRASLRAEFTGWVRPSRRTDLMRGADLLAVPSVWPEPFGLVGVEAGCVGLPAAAFDVGASATGCGRVYRASWPPAIRRPRTGWRQRPCGRWPTRRT